MHISHETDEQIEIRLRKVLSDADLIWHEGSFSFSSFRVTNCQFRVSKELWHSYATAKCGVS